MPENQAFLDDLHKRKVTRNNLFSSNLGYTRSGLHGSKASGCHTWSLEASTQIKPTSYTGHNCQEKLATLRSDPVSLWSFVSCVHTRYIVIKLIGGPETLRGDCLAIQRQQEQVVAPNSMTGDGVTNGS